MFFLTADLTAHRNSCRWYRPRLGPSGTICRRSLRVPGVAVAGDAAVCDARCAKELGVDALVALAGALVAREAAFGRASVEAVVVLQLVERPVVEPQGAGVVGPVGIGAAFVDCGLHDGADRRIGVVVRARKHV